MSDRGSVPVLQQREPGVGPLVPRGPASSSQVEPPRRRGFINAAVRLCIYKRFTLIYDDLGYLRGGICVCVCVCGGEVGQLPVVPLSVINEENSAAGEVGVETLGGAGLWSAL